MPEAGRRQRAKGKPWLTRHSSHQTGNRLNSSWGQRGVAEFMWMWGEAGIEFYKHICTRRYLLLDSEGRCYQRGPNGLKPADVQAELKRVRE